MTPDIGSMLKDLAREGRNLDNLAEVGSLLRDRYQIYNTRVIFKRKLSEIVRDLGYGDGNNYTYLVNKNKIKLQNLKRHILGNAKDHDAKRAVHKCTAKLKNHGRLYNKLSIKYNNLLKRRASSNDRIDALGASGVGSIPAALI